MFCCLTASTTRALLCMTNAEFGIQVIVEAVVACPKPEYCNSYKSRVSGYIPLLRYTILVGNLEIYLSSLRQERVGNASGLVCNV